MTDGWFTVDRSGLSKILGKSKKKFLIFELVSNAWDTEATRVEVGLSMPNDDGSCTLWVIDNDPSGFANLTHAYTLFAESAKKVDSSKRGRFNLGEKLVLSLCSEARIHTTSGTVYFHADGTRTVDSGVKRNEGSLFVGELHMTVEEYRQCCLDVLAMLPPSKCSTYFNGQEIRHRTVESSNYTYLETEIADERGVLRSVEGFTYVHYYQPLDGEVASIYEMGIPVVETGGKFHVDIQQKVPLNLQRDNVSPNYLNRIHASTLNHTHPLLSVEDASMQWVQAATTSYHCSGDSMRFMLDGRFGRDYVSYDEHDPESNKLAVSNGYVVIQPNDLNYTQWDLIAAHKLVKPAGEKFPSPRPFGRNGRVLAVVSTMTEEQRGAVAYAQRLARLILNEHNMTVVLADDPGWGCVGAFDKTKGSPVLYLNLRFLNLNDVRSFDSVLIHEFAHYFSVDHLAKPYHTALCDIGAHMVELAREEHKG